MLASADRGSALSDSSLTYKAALRQILVQGSLTVAVKRVLILQDMRKQRKADDERKARAKAAKEWRQQASSRAKLAPGKGYAHTVSLFSTEKA